MKPIPDFCKMEICKRLRSKFNQGNVHVDVILIQNQGADMFVSFDVNVLSFEVHFYIPLNTHLQFLRCDFEEITLVAKKKVFLNVLQCVKRMAK